MGHLRYADTIIAFSADGRIAEAGPRHEVLAAGGYVAGLLTGADSKTRGDDDDDDIVSEEAEEKKASAVIEAPKEQQAEEAEEEATRDRDVYRYYFRSIGRLNSACFLVGGVCFGVLLKFPGMFCYLWAVFGECPEC